MKQRIFELAHAAQFVPFTILMGDGREYRVPTRDHIFAPPHANAHIVIMDDDGSITLLSGLHINGVRMDKEQPV